MSLLGLFRGKGTGSRTARETRKARLGLEQLDERVLPAVTATLSASGVLRVEGDAAHNRIKIERYGSSGAVMVWADGAYRSVQRANGTFSQIVSPSRITVFGRDGNDTLWTDSLGSYQGYVDLNGGNGNDLVSMAYAASYWESTLIGGPGNDILIGGRFTDHVNGNDGHDVLIGGRGADRLYAGAGDDLVIAGFTKWDAMSTNEYTANHALRTISSYWSNTSRSYDQRWQGLLYGTNGYTGERVDDVAVRTDFERDTLFGDGGRDYFYADPNQESIADWGVGGSEVWAYIWRT